MTLQNPSFKAFNELNQAHMEKQRHFPCSDLSFTQENNIFLTITQIFIWIFWKIRQNKIPSIPNF